MSDLGVARGRIVIDTSQLAQAQQQVQSASRGMSQTLQGLGGAFGIAFGAAAVAQVGRFAVEADKVATSYRRQSVAAVNLAGGQAQLNELLQIYNDVTGGAIDKATALADVTRLMAVGFADSAAELEQFARAARGISVATGQQQDYVISQLQLAIANQSTLRLDQLGLGVAEVKERIDELRSSNKNLTTEMAYQQAILELAEKKFGALVDSAEGAATGLERMTKAWKDFQLAFGEDAGGGTNIIFNQWANDIERATSEMQALSKWMHDIDQAGARWRASMGISLPAGTFNATGFSSGGSIGGRGASGASAAVTRPRFSEDQTAAIVEWARSVAEIEKQSARDRLEATLQFEEQRTNAIRDYEKTIAREAQDFSLQRARAEEDYSLGLQRVHRDIASREASQSADLERTIADARMDAAGRANERQIEFDERIAETRATNQERINELEADFNKRRERSQRDHQESLMDAAGRLDAEAVYRQQRDFATRQRDEREDFDERLEKERKNEEERLAELNKAHAKQMADEGSALQKRIDQAQQAYQRQIEDARAADAQRIEDMAADFQLRKEREDEDRGIRLARLQQDHNDQLEEQARQHELRLIQIAEQEQEARATLDEEFQKELDALGIRTQAYKEKLKEYEKAAIAAFDNVWRHLLGPTQGPQPQNSMITPGRFPSLVTPSVAPLTGAASSTRSSGSIAPSGSRSVTIQPGAIVVNAAPGMNERVLAEFVMDVIVDYLEDQPQ